MNDFYLDDVSDAEIVEPENNSYKFWGLVVAFVFLMFAISGNFSFQTDDFEVTLNESEASYEQLQGDPAPAVPTALSSK